MAFTEQFRIQTGTNDAIASVFRATEGSGSGLTRDDNIVHHFCISKEQK